MASDRAVAAWADWHGWLSCGGQPAFRAWGAVGAAFGHALAGHAGALWQVQDDAQTLHPLGGDRRLGSGLRGSLEGPRQPLRDDRFQRRSRPSTGCGGAKKRVRRALWGGVEEV